MRDTHVKKIRDRVSESYSDALRRAREDQGGCCGRSAPTQPAGVAARSIDYGTDDLPEGALQTSFGCGNPLAFAGVTEGDAVLDLGSGAGLDLCVAARKVGPIGRVIGVDMNEDMIAAAMSLARREGLDNVEIRRGIIEDLPVEDASVDWVISNCVINLSPEKARVFAEIARVLRPGGRFSISDIVADGMADSIREQATAYSACIGGAISEKAYRDGLEAAGLVDITVDDRLVYDTSQIREMIAAENLVDRPGFDLETALRDMTGKVWSMRVRGRRP